MASVTDEVNARRTIDGQRRLGLSTPFSLQVYLPWGKYDHVNLKRAYFKACSNGHGVQFREALYVAQGQGNLTMPKVMSAKLGEEVDFFAAVVAASHNGPPVEGMLEVVGSKESDVSDKPAETDIDKFLGKKKPAKRPVINPGHWKHDAPKRKRFYSDLAGFGFNKYGLKGADKPRIIHEALGVAHLEETPLSQSEATKAVLLFIDNKYGRKESNTVNAKQIDATRKAVKGLLEAAGLPLETYSTITGDANLDASFAADKAPAAIIATVKKYCEDHKPAQNSAQEPPKSNGASETPPSANGHAAGGAVSSEPPAETETAETRKPGSNPFKPAVFDSSWLRMALVGPSGSGKTYTALSVATNLVPNGKVALIDTERGSASKYAKLFKFDVLELRNYHPDTYIRAIKAAVDNGYDVLVIDSLTHAWNGDGGILSIIDKKGGGFDKWKDVNPILWRLVDSILDSQIHIIGTMRVKTDYAMEVNERGKTVPRKVGLAPIQKEGLEYEFDIYAEIDLENTMTISKSRCPELSTTSYPKAGIEVASKLSKWLSAA